ncbi:hypothetical protein DFH06DRAFT_1175117 [Mycena polygramma]|nr:hypothetical protein DFH06DRAFT_1253116 [Mycena polygramma]KAJ7673276.1 hypothetical protein DFH06DRAFT_1175117 [Mycena polygramma]
MVAFNPSMQARAIRCWALVVCLSIVGPKRGLRCGAVNSPELELNEQSCEHAIQELAMVASAYDPPLGFAC